jgi:hypothetical protein
MQEIQERLEHDHKLLGRTVLGEQKVLELVKLALTQHICNMGSISTSRYRDWSWFPLYLLI